MDLATPDLVIADDRLEAPLDRPVNRHALV